jgi:hypothetical protein
MMSAEVSAERIPPTHYQWWDCEKNGHNCSEFVRRTDTFVHCTICLKADFMFVNENVDVCEGGFHPFRVSDEVRREVSAVEL